MRLVHLNWNNLKLLKVFFDDLMVAQDSHIMKMNMKSMISVIQSLIDFCVVIFVRVLTSEIKKLINMTSIGYVQLYKKKSNWKNFIKAGKEAGFITSHKFLILLISKFMILRTYYADRTVSHGTNYEHFL